MEDIGRRLHIGSLLCEGAGELLRRGLHQSFVAFKVCQALHEEDRRDVGVVEIVENFDFVPAPNWPAAVSKSSSIAWSQMQEEAKSLSGQSRRIIPKGCDHCIQNDRHDLANREIASFIAMIRNHQPFPDNRSTTEE